MNEKKTKQIFLSKKDYLAGYNKGKYDYVEPEAQLNINKCKKDTDVLLLDVMTGSGLKVMKAEFIDEAKFMELTKITVEN